MRKILFLREFILFCFVIIFVGCSGGVFFMNDYTPSNTLEDIFFVERDSRIDSLFFLGITEKRMEDLFYISSMLWDEVQKTRKDWWSEDSLASFKRSLSTRDSLSREYFETEEVLHSDKEILRRLHALYKLYYFDYFLENIYTRNDNLFSGRNYEMKQIERMIIEEEKKKTSP